VSLEARYRRALRWYPKSWRAANADAIVGTLLDGAEDRERPRPGEVANLALNGLLARFGWVEKVLPAGVRDRASTVALGFGFGVTVVMLVIQEWAPWASANAVYPQPASEIGPFHGWGGVLYSLWAIGALFALCGLDRAARWMIGLTIPVAVVLSTVYTWSTWLRPPTFALVILTLLAVVVVAGKPGRLALAGTAVFGMAWVLVPFLRNVELVDLQPPRQMWSASFNGIVNGYLAIAIVAVALIALIARNGNWVGAMALIGTLWAVIALSYLVRQDPTGVAVLLVPAVVVALAAFTWLRASGYRVALVRRE